MYRGVVGTSGYKPAKTALKNIEFPKYYEAGLHPLHIEVEGVRRGSPGPIYGSGFTLNGAAALAIGLVLHCIAKGGPGDHVRAVWSLFGACIACGLSWESTFSTRQLEYMQA